MYSFDWLVFGEGRLKRYQLVQPWFQTAFAVGILYEMQHDKKCCGMGKEAV
ncbi:hypothetical protein [Neisseria elongata]|uniref:hypothetical protein n=1 Tax=Neisseria elongata TaxID=495 RepID=UPI000AFE331B|nr:hypothetical protein [Neisseria elongata]